MCTIKNVMVVDDSSEDHFLAERIIKKYDENIDIYKSYDGEDALNKLRNIDKKICILLVDINMPQMNGFEFLAEYENMEKKLRLFLF